MAKKKYKKNKGLATLGRKSRYTKAMDEIAYKLCLLNAIDTQIADVLGITEQTFTNWKRKHPSLFASIKRGKEQADAEVAKALFHRACGYSHPDVHISNYQGEITITEITKHYPPDTAAAFIWLKNRAGWKDKSEHVLEDKRTYTPEQCDVIRKLLAGRCVNADS